MEGLERRHRLGNIPVLSFALLVTCCSTAAPPAAPGDAAGGAADVTASDTTSDTATDARADLARQEAGDGVPLLDGSDAGRCTGALADVGSICASTYAAALTPMQCGEFVWPGACGDLPRVAYTSVDTAVTTASGFLVCVYNGVDAGTLIGAYRSSMTTPYCNSTSSDIRAGEVPDFCGSMPTAAGDSGAIHVPCDAVGD